MPGLQVVVSYMWVLETRVSGLQAVVSCMWVLETEARSGQLQEQPVL